MLTSQSWQKFNSLLASTAQLLFISEQFIPLWRALSNPTVPCQALTKSTKRKTTKVLKVKVNSLKPHLIQKILQPGPNEHLVPPLALSLSQSYQLPVYVSLNKSSWRPVTPSEVDCVKKIPTRLPRRKISTPPHTSVPPGLRLPGFHLPPPPLAIRKLQGGGTWIAAKKEKRKEKITMR